MKYLSIFLSPELIRPNLTIIEVKKKIKVKYGIDEENQRIRVVLDYQNKSYINSNNFWDNLRIEVYVITKFRVPIKRNGFSKREYSYK